ncbi:MAG: phosphate transport system permease protein, partial [Psychromonas sp.]
MTNQLQPGKEPLNINDTSMHSNTDRIKQSLKKRNRKEKRFRLLGRLAISFGFMMVVILFADIGTKAYPAFFQHWIKVDIEFNRQWLNIEASDQSEQALKQANYSTTVKKSLYQMFPSITARGDKRDLVKLLSYSAEFKIEDLVTANPDLLGQTVTLWMLADDDVDSYFKSEFTAGKSSGRINSKQAMWLNQLFESGAVEKRFNTLFFTNSDSREPELAGIRGALSGTILTMIIVLLISFPIGVSAALYLEEFAPKNRWTDIIEVNINN